jgi:DNA-binding MarR family transcriptional regulator
MRNDSSRSRGERGIQRWRAAQHWRRSVERELNALDLTLTRWLVLEATEATTRESADAVSQRAISDRAEIDPMTVSQVMHSLEKRGWVDRGPSASGLACRVLITASGKSILHEGRARIEAATQASRASPPKLSSARSTRPRSSGSSSP